MLKSNLKVASLGFLLAFCLPLVAAAGCIKTRTLQVTANKQNGYGAVEGYPKFFLRPGEYILTFDDGPNPATTPLILKSLEKYCVKATFFMLGSAASKSPDLVRTVAQKGHTIGTHTYSHPTLSGLSYAEAKAQIDNGRNYVGRALNPVAVSGYPTLYRHPSNSGTPALNKYIASQKMIVISYDMSPADWKNEDPNVTMARLVKEMEKNDRGVILLHDIMPNTAKLVPMLMAYIQEKNHTMVKLVP